MPDRETGTSSPARSGTSWSQLGNRSQGGLTYEVGQLDHAVERSWRSSAEDASAVFVADRVASEGSELARSAERVNEVMRRGCEGVSQLFFPPDRSNLSAAEPRSPRRMSWLCRRS